MPKMQNTMVRIHCPHCNLPAKALLDKGYKKFLLYTCPRCSSNVVYFNNKVERISDNLLTKLLRKGKLQKCGDMLFTKKNNPPRDSAISVQDVIDLRILLNTCRDFDEFLSKI